MQRNQIVRRGILGCAHVLALVATTFAWSGSATADVMTSSWSEGFHSKVRLTAATLLAASNKTALYAGVDIRLDKNWKTYWKAPGDGGGIPPEFNWTQSQNVKSIKVMYPVPKLLRDKFGNSIGYKDKVLFPVVVTPSNSALPVKLRLSVYYGVCEDICIPAEAKLQLDVTPGGRATIPVQRDLMAALAKVPAPEMSALRVTRKTAVLDGKTPHLMITTQATASSAPADLFAASVDGEYLPIPKPVERSSDGRSMFRIDLNHLSDPTTLSNKALDLTLVSGGRGITVPWRIK